MSELNAQKILTKGLQSDLNNTTIEDGLLRFTTDTGRLYLDLVNGSTSTRVLISETVDLYTEAEIFNILAPLPKVYVSSDTHRSYVSNGLEWIDLADIRLTATTVKNAEQPIWFSEASDDRPKYRSSLTYNSSTDTLSTPSLKIGNMKITNTIKSDNVSHSVLIEFV